MPANSDRDNRILSADAIAFGYPTAPPVHELDWKRRDETTGFPICKGCDKPIWAEQWVAGTCPGRKPA